MKPKQKYTKRNPKRMGKRSHKLEKILLEELDKLEQEEHQPDVETTNEEE